MRAWGHDRGDPSVRRWARWEAAPLRRFQDLIKCLDFSGLLFFLFVCFWVFLSRETGDSGSFVEVEAAGPGVPLLQQLEGHFSVFGM